MNHIGACLGVPFHLLLVVSSLMFYMNVGAGVASIRQKSVGSGPFHLMLYDSY